MGPDPTQVPWSETTGSQYTSASFIANCSLACSSWVVGYGVNAGRKVGDDALLIVILYCYIVVIVQALLWFK